MNREQSRSDLEYRQRGRRSEGDDRTDRSRTEQGSRGDRNPQLHDEDMTSRRHVHELEPRTDDERDRDERDRDAGYRPR